MRGPAGASARRRHQSCRPHCWTQPGPTSPVYNRETETCSRHGSAASRFGIGSPARRRQAAARSGRPPAMAAESRPISKVLIVVGNPIPCRLFRFLLPKVLLYSVSRFSYSTTGVCGLCSCFVAAMQTEAMPLVNKFELVEVPAHESTSVPFSFPPLRPVMVLLPRGCSQCDFC